MNVVFYISAFIAVITTVAAITRLNPVHALLYFILSLIAVAIIFFIMGAPFAAALTVIVNAGAIMVMFVFVIMMINQNTRSVKMEKEMTPSWVWIAPEFMAVLLFCEFVYILYHSGHSSTSGTEVIPPHRVGASLFGTYLLGAELVSMILLVGLLGAHHLARASHFVKKITSEE
jgi:NADH-quinone oxidoreductase subunit J